MGLRSIAPGFLAFWGLGLLVVSCLPAIASSGGNCVAYARDVTGIRLDGNAASWWPHAEGRYDRGHQPSLGRRQRPPASSSKRTLDRNQKAIGTKKQ